MDEGVLADRCDRFEALYTGALTDTMDELGYPDQTLDPDIAPLRDGMQAAGVAFPITGQPNRDVDSEAVIRDILRMLGDAPSQSILVYDSNDRHSAHIGELSTTSLQARDCRGAVVSGGARDTSFILEQDFPVFCRFRTPADCTFRWEIQDWDVAVEIGDVTVSPGDFVVGDMDGVVVVPQEIATAVLERAEERASAENQVREEVAAGMHPLAAYEEYGVF